jgi:hypothetical protein
VSDELLETKFRDCVSFSARPVSSGRIEEAIGLIRDLEKLSDVTRIVDALTAS